jgi:hypothetical protein
MPRLEERLRAEGYYFPSQEQLAAILYNESFGFRSEHPRGEARYTLDGRQLTPAESRELIRYSRLATALVVINRVRQRVGRRPGWTTSVSIPIAQRVTAPAEMRDTGGYSLSNQGNQEAYSDCLALAGEALQRKFANLRSIQNGYQFYSHTDSALTSTILADRIPVREHIGPLHAPHRAETPYRYLHLAFRLDLLERAERWEQEAVSEFLEPFGVNTRS